MATTQIKRLYQQGTEFVPITLSEAVVVNTSGLSVVGSQGITTLDKILRIALGVVGNSADAVSTLNTAVQEINTLLENKQDTLTAGTGIKIENGVISTTAPLTLYKVVSSLPLPSADHANYIYLYPSGSNVDGGKYKEVICVQVNGQYIWEELGTIQTSVDLSGYITRTEYSQKISSIESEISGIKTEFETIKTNTNNQITAQDITLSNNNSVKIVVNYTIPNNLYDAMVNTDQKDQIIGGN